MANEVRPGMRFRKVSDGRELTARALAPWSPSGYWFATEEKDDVCFGFNDPTYWSPIPEPAPELCAFPGCGKDENRPRHDRCATTIGSFNCVCKGTRKHVDCHPFVAPQAKPVLHEPMPGEVWAYAGKTIGEVTKVEPDPEFGLLLYFGAVDWYWNDGDSWSYVGTPAKPAAKDIPKGATGAPVCNVADLPTVTEAARGGEAAITRQAGWLAAWPSRRVATGEAGESAVAAAPGIEPWRPTVDDWDLLPNAVEGWRR